VTIPVSTLTNTDLTAVTQAFTFSGDAPATAADFYIDHIYYVTGGTSTPQNLALNKPATTTSNENAALEGKYAVDGNINTRWSSAFSDPQSITIDLGADYQVNEVKITWETARAKDYQVLISNDQSNWALLKAVTNNTTLVNQYTGLSGHGRYLRIYGTARGTQYGYSIFELEAYGSLYAGIARQWNAGIYPNPVSGSELRITSSEALRQVKVVDMNGRTWLSRVTREGKVAGSYPLDISRLPAGMYLLQLWNKGGESKTVKFIRH
jgi:hypothetical protein